ncbi:MAG: hypothetical protein ACXWPM_05285 [Bdellovibrionota bacterium]
MDRSSFVVYGLLATVASFLTATLAEAKICRSGEAAQIEVRHVGAGWIRLDLCEPGKGCAPLQDLKNGGRSYFGANEISEVLRGKHHRLAKTLLKDGLTIGIGYASGVGIATGVYQVIEGTAAELAKTVIYGAIGAGIGIAAGGVFNHYVKSYSPAEANKDSHLAEAILAEIAHPSDSCIELKGKESVHDATERAMGFLTETEPARLRDYRELSSIKRDKEFMNAGEPADLGAPVIAEPADMGVVESEVPR